MLLTLHGVIRPIDSMMRPKDNITYAKPNETVASLLKWPFFMGKGNRNGWRQKQTTNKEI